MKHARHVLILVFAVAILALVGCNGTSTGGDSGSDVPDDDVLRVEVAWSEDVDLDLEIWNADGTELIARAWNLNGDDETTAGSEYFDFKDYGADGDFSTGKYVISVYYADYGEDQATAGPHVTWTDPDGDEQERVTAMEFVDTDQWHVVQIDASSREIVEIDEFVDVTTE